MLTPRNIIVTVTLLAVLSIVGSVYELMRPPDGEGAGSDTFGVYSSGYKGLYELLSELNLPVERGLVPPVAHLKRDVCLAFWGPDPEVLGVEPAYLRQTARWVQDGGRLIVAPAETSNDKTSEDKAEAADAKAKGTPEKKSPPEKDRYSFFALDTTALKELGLEKVAVRSIDLEPGEEALPADEKKSPSSWLLGQLKDEPPRPTTTRVAYADGELASWEARIGELRLPAQDLRVIETPGRSPAPLGSVYIIGEAGSHLLVAGLYAVDRGRILLVSDPSLLSNELIAKEGNAVLGASLFSHFGRPIVIDEFYHNLSIRGNPLWLLTRAPYGMLVALLVVASGLWAWRASVFLGPPAPQAAASRRSLAEYVEAMANLFSRKHCRRFALREVRDGTLWVLRKRLGMGAGDTDLDEVARALARRDKAASQRLQDSIQELDRILRNEGNPTSAQTIEAARKAIQCL